MLVRELRVRQKEEDFVCNRFLRLDRPMGRKDLPGLTELLLRCVGLSTVGAA